MGNTSDLGEWVLRALSWLAAAMLGWLGGWDILLSVLLGMIVLDIVVGVYIAWDRGELSSTELRRGIFKKAMYFVVIMVAHGFDVISGVNNIARNAAAALLTGTEMLSILEHAAELDVPIPSALRDAIRGMIDQEDGGEEG